jgi:hypothetical protein
MFPRLVEIIQECFVRQQNAGDENRLRKVYNIAEYLL